MATRKNKQYALCAFLRSFVIASFFLFFEGLSSSATSPVFLHLPLQLRACKLLHYMHTYRYVLPCCGNGGGASTAARARKTYMKNRLQLYSAKLLVSATVFLGSSFQDHQWTTHGSPMDHQWITNDTCKHLHILASFAQAGIVS